MSRRQRPATASDSVRPKKRYTKSVDIVVNEVCSRSGKATIHLNMPISMAMKAMERKAMGLDDGSFKAAKKEYVPGLR